MRRSTAVLITALALLAAVPASAGTTSLPKLFATQIARIHKDAKAPRVLLPASMPLDTQKRYPDGGASGGRWELEIGAVAGCHEASACFVAYFAGVKSSSIIGTRVAVKGASKAGYTPLSCGASCSPPQVEYVVHGIRYTIQANLNVGKGGDKAALIKAAESAIAAGAR